MMGSIWNRLFPTFFSRAIVKKELKEKNQFFSIGFLPEFFLADQRDLKFVKYNRIYLRY